MTSAPRTTKGDPQPAAEANSATTTRRPRTSALRDPGFDASLGARIRAARVAGRITQKALGEALGVTFQQVQKYEKGTDRIAASTLQRLASALGVHPGSFFDDMPAPSGRAPNVRVAMQIAERIQRVRDPVVLKRLMALVDLLVEESDEGEIEPPSSARTGAP